MSTTHSSLSTYRATETESLSDELYRELSDLYLDGLYLQAFEKTKSPVETWTGKKSRVLGARLANNLGSPRVGRTLIRLAERIYPHEPEVIYFHAHSMLSRRGIYESLKRIQKQGDLPNATEVVQADWFALRALLYSIFRDFENADYWMDRALEMQGDRPWIHVQHSLVLDMQDRPKESFAAARKRFSFGHRIA